ncbi:MAG: hypothetical protein WCL32_09540 [Planctomycetota bacterium]|jgi:hypothetical protein
MPLPLPANVRFDLFRWGFGPPDLPEAASVAGHLEGAYDEGQRTVDAANVFRFTHVLLIDGAVHIHDDFDAFTASGMRDAIYVPDAAGTPFDVVYVERCSGFLRVFLNRRAPAWPTNEL